MWCWNSNSKEGTRNSEAIQIHLENLRITIQTNKRYVRWCECLCDLCLVWTCKSAPYHQSMTSPCQWCILQLLRARMPLINCINSPFTYLTLLALMVHVWFHPNANTQRSSTMRSSDPNFYSSSSGSESSTYEDEETTSGINQIISGVKNTLSLNLSRSKSNKSENSGAPGAQDLLSPKRPSTDPTRVPNQNSERMWHLTS